MAARRAYTKRKRVAVRASRYRQLHRQEPLLCVSPKRIKGASKLKHGWNTLPPDLLVTVLRYLQDGGALLACRRVCRPWWACCEDPCLWRGVALSVTTTLSGKAAFWDFANRHRIEHYHLFWHSVGLLARLLRHAPRLSSLVVDKYERYWEELLAAVLGSGQQALSALHSLTLRCSFVPYPKKGKGKRAGSSPSADKLVLAVVDTLAGLPRLSQVHLEGFTGRAFLASQSTLCAAVTRLTLRGLHHADLGSIAALFPGLRELNLTQCTVLCQGSTDCQLSSLTFLILRHCSLDASHLPRLHSLCYGDFAFCCLTTPQLQVVLAALPNGGLTHLDLSGNEVSADVAKLAATKLDSEGGHLVLRQVRSAGLNHHVLLWLQKTHPNAIIVQ